MGPDQQRLTPEERANLVAYLDGELDEVDHQAIDSKLPQSMTARREVEQLRRVWQALELLPMPRPSEDFAAKTLAEVGRSGPARFGDPRTTALGLARVALGLAGVGLAFGLGYLAVDRFWPDPNDRLLRDLSIAERLDEYRDAGSFEFLQQLDKSPAFAPDLD